MNKQATLQFHAYYSDETAIQPRQFHRGYRWSDWRVNGVITYLSNPGFNRS